MFWIIWHMNRIMNKNPNVNVFHTNCSQNSFIILRIFRKLTISRWKFLVFLFIDQVDKRSIYRCKIYNESLKSVIRANPHEQTTQPDSAINRSASALLAVFWTSKFACTYCECLSEMWSHASELFRSKRVIGTFKWILRFELCYYYYVFFY